MEMIPFTYQDSPVRTVLVDGEPWFVAKDVCDHFGVTNRNRVMQYVDDEDKGGTQINTPGGRQNITTVNESGLYTLLFHLQPSKARGISEQEVAEKTERLRAFRRWVTHEVLPSIRKRGGYLTPEAAAEALTDPDFIIRLATDLKAERAKRAELEEARKAERPKVLFADSVATSDSTILVGDLAKILKGNGMEIGANRLFARLREDGFLIKRKGADWNMPTQRAMELGLFKIKESSHIHSDGHVTISKTPKVTGNGQTYLVNHYLKEMEK